MNVSLGRPCERYVAAVVRSPCASAPRYERTSEDALSSSVTTAGVAVADTTGLCAGGAAVARAIGLGVAVTDPTIRAGFFGDAVGFGDLLATGVGDVVGDAVGAVVRTGVAEIVGAASGVGVTTGDGSAAIAVGSALGVFPPPKKCASPPPNSNPAKTTTMIKGNSGNPPRP